MIVPTADDPIQIMPEWKQIKGNEGYLNSVDHDRFMYTDGYRDIPMHVTISKKYIGHLLNELFEAGIRVLVYHFNDDRFEFIGYTTRE